MTAIDNYIADVIANPEGNKVHVKTARDASGWRAVVNSGGWHNMRRHQASAPTEAEAVEAAVRKLAQETFRVRAVTNALTGHRYDHYMEGFDR
jgi:hypothetical protein